MIPMNVVSAIDASTSAVLRFLLTPISSVGSYLTTGGVSKVW